MEFTSRADIQLHSLQPLHWEKPVSMSTTRFTSRSWLQRSVRLSSLTSILAVAWQTPIYACSHDPIPFSYKGWFWWNSWSYKFVKGPIFWI